ncbi:MAG: glucosamine-6-phosphate deaminase [Ignavibacteriae bacterium]|nr:glucosamine-6-phosphate deaminase [Ignavibacteriota bacterium]
MNIYDATSTVEEIALKASGRELLYVPTEKINVIEVSNFPALGKLTAFRFIEWVVKNPGGVISLPTGKTPEHFIKWVTRILARWETKEIKSLLESYGIATDKKPDMRSLRFVQIDEFYPMNAQQHNSFHYYVNEFYIKGFGLDPNKALLINATSLGLPPDKSMSEVFPDNNVDLTLRVRQTWTDLERLQKEVINRVDVFCMEYESKIREMGGIGFFLGGIGPDGHIAFNVRGSSVFSVTRLTGTNYETQAAAATDLGGIEISRSRLVITIGLATITYNPTATALIIAAGDAKAPIASLAIQEKKNPQYPASVLQDLPNSRFYLTHGAASLLVERQYQDFVNTDQLTDAQMQEVVTSIALKNRKALTDLTQSDCASDRFGSALLVKTEREYSDLATATRESMEGKIRLGLKHISQTTFLHTEPHHDDIMLAYLAHIYHLVRDPSNQHYFANLTSGFTSVSNAYCLSLVQKLKARFNTQSFADLMSAGYFDPKSTTKRMEDVYLYLDGAAENNPARKDEAEARRLLRNMVEVYQTTDLTVLKIRLRDLNEYLVTQYPGAKDPPDVQTLKGTLREWEVELLWAYLGIETSSVFPLRLGFYKGDIFSEEPEVDRDVIPIFELMKKVKPNVVSVAFDPEGSGPDTHYKALQAVAEALKMYEKHSGDSTVRVWGYRNVWYRFKPSEANLMVPVSLNSLSMLHTAFMNCFGSQSAASFPSYEHDGPFSQLAQKIQVEQYKIVKTCLGKDFFLKNDHPRLRAARGMIFLCEMNMPEFFEKVRELKKKTENV